MAAVDEGGDSDEIIQTVTETGSLRTEALPYNFAADALQFEISGYRLDGEEPGSRGELMETRHELSLKGDSGWEILEVSGSVELDSETLHEAFPPDELDDTPGRLMIVIECAPAIIRTGEIIADEPIEPGDFTFEIQLERDRYYEVITLIPFLVRTTSLDSAAPGKAKKPASRLANGEEWVIRLDERPVDGGLLQPWIEPFSEIDHFPDESHIHYLDLGDAANPQLYLNGDHGAIVSVLNTEGTWGAEARLRDVVFGYIEHSVWTQLILRTAQDVDPDTGQPEHDWQEDVIDIFYDELYDHLDRDEAANKLADDIADPESLNLLLRDIERAVNQRIDIPNDIQSWIEEGIQYGD